MPDTPFVSVSLNPPRGAARLRVRHHCPPDGTGLPPRTGWVHSRGGRPPAPRLELSWERSADVRGAGWASWNVTWREEGERAGRPVFRLPGRADKEFELSYDKGCGWGDRDTNSFNNILEMQT